MNSTLATHSLFSEEEARYLNFPDKDAFKKTIIGKIVLAIYRATLNDPHASVREQAAKSLKELTRQLNGDLVLLHRYWLTLYDSARSDSENRVRTAANEVLSVLAETLSNNPEALRTFWLPLFLEALEEKDPITVRVMSENFKAFIRYFAFDRELMQEIWFPFFRANITSLNQETKDHLWEGATLLAKMYSDEFYFVKTNVLPLIEKTITEGGFIERGIAAESLGIVAHALPKNLSSIQENWLPLYEKALEKEPFKANKSLGGLIEAFSDDPVLILEHLLPLIDKGLQSENRLLSMGAAASLGQIALAFKGNPDFLEQQIIPLYEKAFHSKHGDTRKTAVRSLSNLVESIIETPTPFTRTILSFYQKEIKDSFFQMHTETIMQLPSLAKLLSKDRSLPADEWLPLFSNSFETRSDEAKIKLAECITPLAVALANDLDTLENKWFPLYIKVAMHDHPQVRSKASDAFGELALQFKNNPTYLKEKILPLFEKALMHSEVRVRIAASASLYGIAEAFNGNTYLINEYWFKYFNRVNYDSNNEVSHRAASSIGGLARSLSGDIIALKELVVPLYKRGVHHPDPIFRRILTESLGTLASSVKGDLKSIREDIFPLYTHGLNDSNFAVRIVLAHNLAELAEATFPKIDTISPAESTQLAEYFLAHENLNQDSSLATLLGVLLLIRGYPKSLPLPTETWENIINLLPFIIKEPPDKLGFFSYLTQQALGRKGKSIDPDLIKEKYKEYFNTDVIPKRKSGPKHLIAVILLDYELKKWDLPTEYTTQLRQLRRGTAYTEIVPIIEKLSRPHDSSLRNAILGFTEWSHDLQPKEVKPFWGTIQRLLEQISRNNESYQSLGIQSNADEILTLYHQPAENKFKAVQQALAKLERLIPERAAEIFRIGLSEEDKKRNKIHFDQRELNVLQFIARIPEYREPEHPMFKELKDYFTARLKGMDRKRASKKFAVINSFRIVAEPAFGKVSLKKTNQARERRIGQWKDAVRHLNHLLRASTNPELIRQLRAILDSIPKTLSVDEAEHFSTLLIEFTLEFDSSIPTGSKALWKTIKTHLKNVQDMIPKEREFDVKPQEFDPSLVPFKEVEIYHSTDPIEILNLGWPYLGSSCLDIVRGGMKHYAPGYLLNNNLMILYIQEPHKKDKPLARISVGLFGTKEEPLFVLLSPIKANSPYDFRPLLESYLLGLAAKFNGEAFFPLDLYREPSNSFKTELVEKKLYFGPGKLPFYSDLTDEITNLWSGIVDGFILTPRQEESLEMDRSI